MKIGIGLPATIPGVSGERILEWAKKADAGPFSSFGIIDRIAYSNYEALITLAAVAGATQRVRLMPSVLLAPVRNTGVLAKQAATLDAISGGRLTLGLGIGGREDDYRAAPASFNDRGKRFGEQLAQMKRIWSGQSAGEGVGPVGPPPSQAGGPEILIGGFAPAAVRRAGRLADGFLSPAPPDATTQLYSAVEEAWKTAGRAGKPRLVCATYYALGPNTEDRGRAYVRDYYAFMGPGAENAAQGVLTTPEAIRDALQRYSDIGTDEFILWPSVTDLDQVDRLAEIVG